MQAINQPISRDAFRGLVQRNKTAGRLAGRPAKPERDKVVASGMHLYPVDLERAKRVAEIKDRSVSYYMRVSFLKQLAKDEEELGIAEQQKAAAEPL
ncbi:hypothetical protein G7047_13455 [Diaphorobacter sp. HDW4A]|uniref:hypothetical protein n=1 Tax=Diaphorobacter sp. HDW4A TaxID=2714924 RepID=UPI00140D99E6|nr:hypothetical protein [Diaphorobacter sp. HDW4A]QIL78486.1 hypothetical protein G7047_00030 [Diaphorobacter sp. HDW4A]QIL80798.1 hypothetical protein G7047_13455 [Diaphorobacter sp. HDW4A]